VSSELKLSSKCTHPHVRTYARAYVLHIFIERVCARPHTYVSTRSCACMRVHACIHAYVCDMRMHVYAHTRTRARTHVCMYSMESSKASTSFIYHATMTNRASKAAASVAALSYLLHLVTGRSGEASTCLMYTIPPFSIYIY